MDFILKPLQVAGHEGIKLISGDGAVRLCYSILAVHIANYPEQVMVTLIKTLATISEGTLKLKKLFQGIIKHVIDWIQSAVGDAEIDARCWWLPPNHHIWHFMKGICNLSRFQNNSGLSSHQLVQAVCALLDFVQLARYPVHSDETLELLQAALETFHDNKVIFVNLKICSNFNIIKLHYMQHYRSTNGKDKFTQMTLWLEQKEWCDTLAGDTGLNPSPSGNSGLIPTLVLTGWFLVQI
ncbi:hypothetical protein BDQ17DRAFT_1330637 [Cyathus striatus]|nr:hypothetical protein BDQ17DRAFT_1330637 [Cyathus striatus]